MGGRINGQNPNTKAQIRAIGLAHKGQPNPPGRAAKGPDHWKAKWWHFRSPAGFTIEGFNLSHLIRENSHLFDPCDVVWKDFSCNASKRLAQLMSDDGKLCSWHGWVAVGSRERADMLSRKLDPPK
jgi:hypothetical protein